MKLSKDDAAERLESDQEYLEKRLRWIEEGRVDGDQPGPLFSLADASDAIAKSLAVLGRDEEAIQTFADAAEYYVQHIDAAWREHPDVEIVNIPAMVTRAIQCSALGRDPALLEDASQRARELAEHEPATFAYGAQADDLTRSVYFGARLLGLIVEGADADETLLQQHRDAGESNNPDHLIPINDAYRAILEDDEDALQNAVDRHLEAHTQRFVNGYEHVTDAVDVVGGNLAHLAARRGLTVTIDHKYVPAALLPADDTWARSGDGG